MCPRFCFDAFLTVSLNWFLNVCSVPLTKEHLEALNAYVFHRVPVEEVGLVPAALEWVKLECQLGTSQRRYTLLRRWKEARDSEALARMLYEGQSVPTPSHAVTETAVCLMRWSEVWWHTLSFAFA